MVPAGCPSELGGHGTHPHLAPGREGASTYRDFDLFVNGQPVGEAVSTWVLADAATHKLARMGRITEFQGTDGGLSARSATLSRVRLPETMEHADSRAMHYSDTASTATSTNVRYVDFLCDALHMDAWAPAASSPPSRWATWPSAWRGRPSSSIPARPAACGTSTGRIRRQEPV